MGDFFSIRQWCGLLLGCALVVADAASQTPLLEAITIEQGLSQGYVIDICQDREGFMWFGTNVGLNRYDGYGFQHFLHDPYDSNSLSDNQILAIEEAGDFLGVVTMRGLDLFHYQTRRFFHVPVPATSGICHGPLLKEGEGAIWCPITMPGGLVTAVRVSWPAAELGGLLRSGKELKDLIRAEINLSAVAFRRFAISTDQKTLWLAHPDTLVAHDVLSGAERKIAMPGALASSPIPDPVLSDGAQGVWLQRDHTFFHFNGSDWEVFPCVVPQLRLLGYSAEDNLLWVSTDVEVYGINEKNLSKPLSLASAKYRIGIPEGIICMYTDNYDNTWFGTDARGIRKFNRRNRVFKSYLPGQSVYSHLVPGVSERVWIGSINPNKSVNGVLELRSGRLRTLSELGIPVPDRPMAIITDTAQQVWIAHRNEILNESWLFRCSPEGKVLEKIMLPADYRGRLPSLKFRAHDEIWMANNQLLLRFNIHTKQFTQFRVIPQGLRALPTTALEFTPDGSWWVGTAEGLIRIKLLKPDPQRDEDFSVTKLVNDPKNRNSLPDNHIKSLLPDPQNPKILWIGMHSGGLCRLDLSKQEFVHFNTHNGLPDNTVYGILAEELPSGSSSLWLSTNRGLARFTPERGVFQYFNKSDGLQDNEFNTYAFGKMPDGRLLFGGVNGVTVFAPQDLSTSAVPPKVLLSKLLINGEQVSTGGPASPLDQDLQFTQHIELPYSQNNLVLHFAAADFTQPQRNQFAFYLEGAEQEWIHRGFEHSAQYLNLRPGRYVFKVKASNSDGVWNETPTTLHINIRPPWYLSGWAYAIYFLLAFGGIYSVYQLQLRRRLDHAEAERLKALDGFKSRFFTNISHEFRTPLTVILGMVDRWASDGARWTVDELRSKMNLIRRNGENLLRLVNQILDLARLESNTLQMNYVQDDVLAYLRYVSESLHSHANARNVLVRVESPEASGKIMMDFDPERLLQIVHNLLSNAIKFTPSGGKVVLNVSTIAAPNRQTALRLNVSDTGSGIPEADLPHIFERFFQARNQEHAKEGGAGIGLSLTRELVRAMNGDISVISRPGEGTVFSVVLPITNLAEAPPRPQDAGHSLARLSTATIGLPERQASTGKTGAAVLIVEDNPDVVEYLGACLGGIYQLEYAYNGRAGIEKALETVPDLIVSDVMMPEKDGFELCNWLKSDQRTSHVPIVLLTARAGVEDRIAGLRHGADAYLAKPFHPEELLATLANLLDIRQKLQAKYSSWLNPSTSLPSNAGKLPLADPEDTFLQKLREVVESQLTNANLSVEDICRAMGMSHPVIHRKISALTGRSLTLYVRSLRLRHAQIKLADPSRSISEVAYDTGFNDPKFFSRVFSEEFGISPTVFRQNLAKQGPDSTPKD